MEGFMCLAFLPVARIARCSRRTRAARSRAGCEEENARKGGKHKDRQEARNRQTNLFSVTEDRRNLQLRERDDQAKGVQQRPEIAQIDRDGHCANIRN